MKASTTTTERDIMDTTNKANIAYDRGFVRGSHDCAEGFYNEAPLSGEWAGESIPELLGDLFDEDFGNFDEVCERYEEGYNKAFSSDMGRFQGFVQS
jgi:hypothetical protein